MNSVIITGASSGIGLETAKLYAGKGINTLMVGTRDGSDVLEEVRKQAPEGTKVYYFRCDVSVDEEVRAMTQYAVEKLETIDVLVNNAGIFAKGRLHEHEESVWEKIFDVDVKSIYLTGKYIIPVMIEQGYGSIVNVGSASGIRGDYNMAAYNAAKGAVVNLTRAMALDYGADGIRTNCVCPSACRTPLFEKNPQEVIELFEKSNPIKRICTPIEVAKMIYFVSSEDASSTNGAILTVTGGMEVYSGQPVQL